MSNIECKNADDNKKEATTAKNKKKCTGRRKIPIKTITNSTKKHITFSKRRVGLFKKASELCALCGVELAILTFSERGKVFSFGHPNPDAIINRYLWNESHCLSQVNEDSIGFNGVTLMVDEHNQQYEEIKRKIDEEERKRLCQIEKEKENNAFWWDEASVDDMGLDELEQFMTSLLELRNNIANRVDQLTGSTLLFLPNQMGNSFAGPIFNYSGGLQCLENARSSNDQLNMLSANKGDLTMFEDTKVDVSHNFNCELINEAHVMNDNNYCTHFSKPPQGIEMIDFVGINYPNPRVSPPTGF